MREAGAGKQGREGMGAGRRSKAEEEGERANTEEGGGRKEGRGWSIRGPADARASGRECAELGSRQQDDLFGVVVGRREVRGKGEGLRAGFRGGR